MISKFDKSCAAALYKRKFGECLEDYDYEGALDNLHKFTAEKSNPQFHMACGMLYLLMTQDSDDPELLTLAYREFMMYLRTHPDSTEAYRNIIATVFLRREPLALYEWSKALRESGLDGDKVFEELERAGISKLIPTESDYLDLESLFNDGDFGIIDPHYVKPDTAEVTAAPVASGGDNDRKKSSIGANKIISFRGASEKTSDKTADADKPSKILRIEDMERAASQSSESATAEAEAEQFVEFIKALADSDDGEFEIKLTDVQDTSVETSQLRAGLALQEAEYHSEHGNYEKALCALDKIAPEDGRLYYCGECVRAFILLETNDIEGARKALKHAFEFKKDGALASTLMCRIYEIEERYDKIPRLLKKIDVKDFVDADHVYRAMRFAIKYCTADDALDLAEDYIEEYNIFDLRMLYAQMLYNSGDRESAIDELYLLTRIFYDDFNTLFYYLMARSGVDKMPVSEEVPQDILGMLVDDIMSELQSGFDRKVFDENMLKVGLETFVTLEFDNDKRTMVEMFDALKKLAALPELKKNVRNALVSPYVEPLVKAVMLSELYAQGYTDELLEIGYCPVYTKFLPVAQDMSDRGVATACAFITTLKRDRIDEFVALADTLSPYIAKSAFDEKQIANYLIKKVRGKGRLMDKSTDVRIDFALGFSSKTAANQAYKEVSKTLDPILSDKFDGQTNKEKTHE